MAQREGDVLRVGRQLDWMFDQEDRGAGADGIGCEAVAIRALAAKRDKETARNDIARVNRGGGEGGDARRPEEAGPGGSQEIVEPD